MADALTSTQVEILRRIRAGVSPSDEPYIKGFLSEVALLNSVGLVEIGQPLLMLSLTDLGSAYLADAEQRGR
jgi:hypothetical protein